MNVCFAAVGSCVERVPELNEGNGSEDSDIRDWCWSVVISVYGIQTISGEVRKNTAVLSNGKEVLILNVEC